MKRIESCRIWDIKRFFHDTCVKEMDMQRKTAVTLGLAMLVAGLGALLAGCGERVEYRHDEPGPAPCPPRPVPAWTEISGRVFAEGKPCEKGRVTVFWGKGRSYRQDCGIDKKGYFAVSNIPARREICIEFRGVRHKREYITTRSLRTGRAGEIIQLGVIDIVECRPEPGPRPKPMPGPCPGPAPAPCPGPAPHPRPADRCDLKVSGCVFFDGKPIKDATVRVVCPGMYECKTKTDKEGYFRVKDVPRKARINVYAERAIHHGKLIGSASVNTGRDNIDIGVINMCKKK